MGYDNAILSIIIININQCHTWMVLLVKNAPPAWYPEVNQPTWRLLTSKYFRVSMTDDVLGVEAWFPWLFFIFGSGHTHFAGGYNTPVGNTVLNHQFMACQRGFGTLFK